MQRHQAAVLDSLEDRIARARRTGLPVVLTVRNRCPRCGSSNVRRDGTPEGVGRCFCRACGSAYRAIAADPGEVTVAPRRDAEVTGIDAAFPKIRGGTVAARCDGIAADTAAEVAHVLADYPVRLATVRTERRVSAGLEPLAADLKLMQRAAGMA